MREATRPLGPNLAGWLVGADTGYSCWFKKRERTDARVHRVDGLGRVGERGKCG